MKIRTLLLSLCTVIAVQAKVQLPSYWTDNMVLQQQSELTISGTAKAGKEVVVTSGWNNYPVKTRADKQGNWSVTLSTPQAGGPYTLTFSDGERLTLKNILIGEVWFCSGQSNMEMPVAGWGKVKDYEKEIREADYPFVRLFQVKKNTSFVPTDELTSTMNGWQECSSSSIPEFSAVAYFYARELWNKSGIPVGVIDATWGGTPVEAWTAAEALKGVASYRTFIERMESVNFSAESLQMFYEVDKGDWFNGLFSQDKGMQGVVPAWAQPQLSDKSEWRNMDLPGCWEEKELGNFDGVVWFRKKIALAESWRGKQLTLRLCMIDDEDITYCNGQEIARTSGFITPRVYTIPASMTQTEELLIAVRVTDYEGGGGIHGDPADLYISLDDNNKQSLVGAWEYNVGFSLENYPPVPVSPSGSSYPSVLYNAMVHPLINFPIKGVIWYQGCSNIGRDAIYGDQFCTMIADWRNRWNNPDMPFYFVQVANYLAREEVQPDSKWALLREAQAQALNLANTGMVTTIDIGEAADIHPKNKQEVGRRLAQLSLFNTYGKKVVSAAPSPTRFVIEGNKVRFSFSDEEALRANADVKGFIVAGADRKFYPAKAVADGNEVIVTCPQVLHPLAVRYAWADNPECTLAGESGLPVSPFRTDKW